PMRRYSQRVKRLPMNRCQLAMVKKGLSTWAPNMPIVTGSFGRQWFGARIMPCPAAIESFKCSTSRYSTGATPQFRRRLTGKYERKAYIQNTLVYGGTKR